MGITLKGFDDPYNSRLIMSFETKNKQEFYLKNYIFNILNFKF